MLWLILKCLSIAMLSLLYVFFLAYMFMWGVLTAYDYFIKNKVEKINNLKKE